MNYYKSKKNIILLLDIIAIVTSFLIAIGIRYKLLIYRFGSYLVVSTYVVYFIGALIIYGIVFMSKAKPKIEKQSYKEIVLITAEQQIVFIATYIVLFFLFHNVHAISRVVVGAFFIGNTGLCSGGRIIYHNYCVKETERINGTLTNLNIICGSKETTKEDVKKCVQHVYIIGNKSIGQYGGFESFVMNLLQNHKDNTAIKYHVSCKANGNDCMNVDKLSGAVRINDSEFNYCNAHCFMVEVPEKLGSAQAIFYDLKALEWVCDHIENNHIGHPIVYILAARIGPFEKKYVKRIHDAGGLVYQNPDGHEDWRKKWNYLIRKYWKFSEGLAVKYADLIVCDSKNIEKYINDEYSNYNPKTTYIAYGSNIEEYQLDDLNSKYLNWLDNHDLRDGQYFISVGRFVPENNFETMIREYMLSSTNKDFAIITTENSKYAEQLQQKLRYRKDHRIKFVGTVYDAELLGKIRANAYGYFHGHEVGGTNPSLLEALGATKLNLLYDVGFNREVAEDSALYWNKDEGNLAKLIDRVDVMSKDDICVLGDKAKQRIRDSYSWELICSQYMDIFLNH